ncbi:MAG: AraC family transcriptional regulator [Eubacteriales bacterium]|nr:AraC family transcriptional regulator [Eubacteriales bacterium]
MRRDLEERKPHGSEGFAFQAYNTAVVQSRTNFVASHWHDEIEIIQMLYGQADLVVEGKLYQMKAGELWFCNPREIHQISNEIEQGGYQSMVFSLDVLGNILEDSDSAAYLSSIREKWNFPRRISTKEEDWGNYSKLVSRICDLYVRKPIAWKMEIRAALTLLIVELLRNQRFVLKEENVWRERSQMSEHLRTLLHYIVEHYGERITLEEAAGIVHLSPRYFCTFFHDNFHMSFVSYLNRYRIEQACTLLNMGEYTVTEVAMRVGFDNISYFIRKFREMQGCTPTEYRKRNEKLSGKRKTNEP